MASSNAPFSKRSLPAYLCIDLSSGLRASFDNRFLTYIILEIFERIVAFPFNLEASRTKKVRFWLRRLQVDGYCTVVYSISEVMNTAEDHRADIKMFPVIFFGPLNRLINAKDSFPPFFEKTMNQALMIEHIR